MNEQKLTAEQVLELQPYERHFTQATRAAWCSYPGQAGIAKMLDIWESLTGSKYPYQPGCSNCLLNLVRDLGTIYFAQKDSVLAELKEKAKDETFREVQVGDYRPDLTQKAAEVGKTTAEPRKGRKSPKK